MTDRRAVVLALVGSLLANPQPLRAQPTFERILKVAILSPGAIETRAVFMAFRIRLRELGYEEGRDVSLRFYLANGSTRLASLAQEIVKDDPHVVLVDGRFAALAMFGASRKIPIVAVTSDPVGLGLAESLSHPGGNVTGVATMSLELAPKQLEFVREIAPSSQRIGVIDALIAAPNYRALDERAASLGVTLAESSDTNAGRCGTRSRLKPFAVSTL